MILRDHRDAYYFGGLGLSSELRVLEVAFFFFFSFFLVVFSEQFSEYCWKTIQDSQRPKTDRREKVSSSTQKSVDTASQ